VYDAEGNTVGSGAISYIYDFENHLAQQGGASFVYDGDGNRVQKTVAGNLALYFVDNVNLSGYPQVLAEETASTFVLTGYIWGGGPDYPRDVQRVAGLLRSRRTRFGARPPPKTLSAASA
jgi:hypothetical protein